MKRLILILTLLVSLFATSCIFDMRDTYKVVKGGKVYLEPSLDAERGRNIKSNVYLRAIKVEGDWVYVKYKSYAEGYIHKDNLELSVAKSPRVLSKARREKAKELPWYNPKRWGIIGWIVRWLIILPLLSFGGFIYPIYLLLYKTPVPNFICQILIFVGGFFLVKFYIYIILKLNLYYGDQRMYIFFGTLAVGYIYTLITMRERCPECQHIGADTIDSQKVRHTEKEYKVFTDGPRKGEREMTSSLKHYTTRYKRQCRSCHATWWS